MTDNIIQKLEEKIILLVTELESMRKEFYQFKQENDALKSERIYQTRKLQELVSLLDTLDIDEPLPILSGMQETV